MNDILTCTVGQTVHPIQVSFFRFVVTALSVLPFMLPKGALSFRTKMPALHFWRALMGAFAIGCGAYSVLRFPLLKNTCISFTEPLFFLPLAVIFLREKVDTVRWGCTLLGFLGIVLITYQDFRTFNLWVLVPLLGTLAFAVMDLLAKKMVYEETLTTLLFYFGLGTSLVFLVPALLVWEPLTWKQAALLTGLGVNGNLIQICMFQAFKAADVSGLMPLRYTEFLFTFLGGWLFFSQVPTLSLLAGGVLIIVSACVVTLWERRKERGKR